MIGEAVQDASCAVDWPHDGRQSLSAFETHAYDTYGWI
jgi:hypothetical protein